MSGGDVRHRGADSGGTPRLERIVAAAGAVIVAAFLGTLAWSAWEARGTRLSVFELRSEAPILRPDGVHVEVVLRNAGRITAAQAQVAGRLMVGVNTVETRHLTFDYAPARSERRATMLFEEKPDSWSVSLDVEGYRLP